MCVAAKTKNNPIAAVPRLIQDRRIFVMARHATLGLPRWDSSNATATPTAVRAHAIPITLSEKANQKNELTPTPSSINTIASRKPQTVWNFGPTAKDRSDCLNGLLLTATHHSSRNSISSSFSCCRPKVMFLTRFENANTLVCGNRYRDGARS